MKRVVLFIVIWFALFVVLLFQHEVAHIAIQQIVEPDTKLLNWSFLGVGTYSCGGSNESCHCTDGGTRYFDKEYVDNSSYRWVDSCSSGELACTPRGHVLACVLLERDTIPPTHYWHDVFWQVVLISMILYPAFVGTYISVSKGMEMIYDE